MSRPEVPHCAECSACMLKAAKGGGWHRFCTEVTSGPPAPVRNDERRHTSPDWCPRRYGSIIRLEYETIAGVGIHGD